MARLFLLSLQNMHSNLLGNLIPENNDGGDQYQYNSNGFLIEELSSNNNNDDAGETNPAKRPHQRKGRHSKRNNPHGRMRVLWPPLGPGVDTAMAWTKEEATKRPFLAVALGLTLWPVAISTALVGTSVSLIDGAVQDAYQHFQDAPLISTLEQGVAQAYQAGRFTLATGKLVGRQSLRVAKRQLDRRGGILPIAQDLGGMALDRITHPIDTIGKVWDSVHWGFGAAKDASEEFMAARRERQENLI